MSRTKKTTIEEMETLYDFLADGKLPDGVKVQKSPKLGRETAFSVIWFLQEITEVLPDYYEACDSCHDLFDDHGEGRYDEDTGKHYCDGCG